MPNISIWMLERRRDREWEREREWISRVESSIRYEERNSIQKSCLINEFQFLIFFFPSSLLSSFSSSSASLSPYFQNSFATLILSPHLNSLSHFQFTSALVHFCFRDFFFLWNFFFIWVFFFLWVLLVSWLPKLFLKIRDFQNFGKILVSKSFALSHNQFLWIFSSQNLTYLKLLFSIFLPVKNNLQKNLIEKSLKNLS